MFFAKPETCKLDLPARNWVLVKKRLTAGEQRDMLSHMMKESGAIDSVQVGVCKLVAYILDWSITDANDQPIVIFDQGDNALRDALNKMTTDGFSILMQAVDEHMAAVEREDEEEKKRILAGGNGSSPTLNSAEPLVGAMNG